MSKKATIITTSSIMIFICVLVFFLGIHVQEEVLRFRWEYTTVEGTWFFNQGGIRDTLNVIMYSQFVVIIFCIVHLAQESKMRNE